MFAIIQHSFYFGEGTDVNLTNLKADVSGWTES